MPLPRFFRTRRPITKEIIQRIEHAREEMGRPRVTRGAVEIKLEAEAERPPITQAVARRLIAPEKRRAVLALNEAVVNKEIGVLRNEVGNNNLCNAKNTYQRNAFITKTLQSFKPVGLTPERGVVLKEALDKIITSGYNTEAPPKGVLTVAGRGLNVVEKNLVERIYEALSQGKKIAIPYERFRLEASMSEEKALQIRKAILLHNPPFPDERKEVIANAFCLKAQKASYHLVGLEGAEREFVTRLINKLSL